MREQLCPKPSTRAAPLSAVRRKRASRPLVHSHPAAPGARARASASRASCRAPLFMQMKLSIDGKFRHAVDCKSKESSGVAWWHEGWCLWESSPAVRWGGSPAGLTLVAEEAAARAARRRRHEARPQRRRGAAANVEHEPGLRAQAQPQRVQRQRAALAGRVAGGLAAHPGVRARFARVATLFGCFVSGGRESRALALHDTGWMREEAG